MPVDVAESLPITRTVRYRTEDPIGNFRLKVVLQVEDPENPDAEWVRKERVFGWQEKVFGKREFDKYDKLARESTTSKKKGVFSHQTRLSPLDIKYLKQMEYVPEGEILFSYVDADSFKDEETMERNMTTAQAERPTALTERMREIEAKRGRHTELATPFRLMCIAAELKARKDGQLVSHEYVICRLKYYEDGRLDITPGFSPQPNIKVDIMKHSTYTVVDLSSAPYRIQTPGGFGYHFWLSNDTEPTERGKLEILNHKSVRFHQDVYEKAQELRRNFVGDEFEPFTDTPEQHSLKMMLNLEIVSGYGFDDRSLYVQYLVQAPEGWEIVSEEAP
eukprot:CAMPEP_0181335308 /NCGR_PEP_ID=MMETSP1101-20121128/26760_1 /TAXON_ID=46948 /ORGANISM="Rhodomonas abbreviata, Strain Caron Lab Isolate" /LENGTH=333 /DNA_ID=CAMNT_0023445415 /DNA_START=69 /DNA_END=1066 /DNA_ORIENTATION=+